MDVVMRGTYAYVVPLVVVVVVCEYNEKVYTKKIEIGGTRAI